MQVAEAAGRSLYFTILITYFIAYLPITLGIVFLLWRLVSTRLLGKRATLKAPLIALALNAAFTACFMAIQKFVSTGSNPFFLLSIGVVLAIMTITIWIYDSLSWRRIKKGTRYLTRYIVASICLILVLATCGIMDGVKIRIQWAQGDAAWLASVKSVGTQLYLPKDTTDTTIYIRSAADKKHFYLYVSKMPLSIYQYNNISIPSKLHCYPNNPDSSYDLNKTDEPSGCTYMGEINGMEVWGYNREYDNHPEYDDHRYAYKVQCIFAHISTTTIAIDYIGNTPNNALSYIKSLHPATYEEVSK